MEYRHTTDMGEISGFGGDYETCCQDMLNAGVQWLQDNKNAKLEGHTFKNVYGVFVPDSQDAQELDRIVLDAAKGEATGAMHHAVMSRLLFIAQNGWEKYCEELKKDEAA